MTLCYHPNMRPTEWNQPKPEPAEMRECKCGQNRSCSICGHGHGSWPCRCVPELSSYILTFPPCQCESVGTNLLEDGIVRYRDIYTELAKR